MSILITGMEMPKDGAFVEVLIWSDGHVTQTGDSYFAEDGRAYYQPCDWKYFSAVQVPPHGRLIDADAFMRDECNSCDGACESLPCDCVNCHADCRCEFLRDILDAPTIIPAEE